MEETKRKLSVQEEEPLKGPDVPENNSSLTEKTQYDGNLCTGYITADGGESKENDEKGEALVEKPSNSVMNESEVFYDCAAVEFNSGKLVKKFKREAVKKNSESEISGSESDSDSSKTFFMKSDSDTSLETVVDNKLETDFKDDNEKPNDITPSPNLEAETPSQENNPQATSNPPTPKEVTSLIAEASKVDCDSGFSSQIDMTHFTADVMTLRHEVPVCDHKGTPGSAPAKQVYFSTNEGSIITFEYTIQNEVLGNFDKFNNTCIDLVKKECPNKMAQLVYQAGLKALDTDNRKHLCCVFMLDNDKGQIDKLFESAKKESPVSEAEKIVVIKQNHNCPCVSKESTILKQAVAVPLPEDEDNDGPMPLTSHILSASWSEQIALKNKSLGFIPGVSVRASQFPQDLRGQMNYFNTYTPAQPTNTSYVMQQKENKIEYSLQGKMPENIVDANRMASGAKIYNTNAAEKREEPKIERSLDISQAIVGNALGQSHPNIQKSLVVSHSQNKKSLDTPFLSEPVQNVKATNVPQYKLSTKEKKYQSTDLIEDINRLKIGSVGANLSTKKKIVIEAQGKKTNVDEKTTRNRLEKTSLKKTQIKDNISEMPKSNEAGEIVKINNANKRIIDIVLPSDKPLEKHEVPSLTVAPKKNPKLLHQKKSVHEETIKPKRTNKLLEKTMAEKFHTVNTILRVNDNAEVTNKMVKTNAELKPSTLRSFNKRKEITSGTENKSNVESKTDTSVTKSPTVKSFRTSEAKGDTKKSSGETIIISSIPDSKENTNTALFPKIMITEKMLSKLTKKKIKLKKRSSSCSRLSEKIKVTFLSKTKAEKVSSPKHESSTGSWSDESALVDDTKPQFVRSAIHLLNSADPPYTPYKIVWIKSIIKRIDKIGILECNVDIPPKMRPKPVDNTTGTNIRPVISRSNSQLGGLVAGGVQSNASASNSLDMNYLEPNNNNQVRVWQPPPRDEFGNIYNPQKTYRLNANAAEYVPVIYNYKGIDESIESCPDIYMEFKPDIIKRPYRTINPYDSPANTRFLPKQQVPFFPGGVYVARNGNIRLNLRSFISIDITVDLGIRVTYPFSRIFLALSSNGNYAAMVHPYGRVYQYHDIVEANIYDEYTGVCKYAKMTDRAIYFTNDLTNKVYLVDKFGAHRNRTAEFFNLKEDFTPAVLVQSGRHGSQYNEEAAHMLTAAKFETCGFNNIIIIKNVKIIQYPTGNLSIFRFNRRDHIQVCPTEGHCKISTPNVHITGTIDITDTKPHVFIRRSDKRISFSHEKFFVRSDGQTAGYDNSNQVFIDYPI